MTSHLCTMLQCIPLYIYIVFLTVNASYSGIETKKSPFGPLMCNRLCLHTVDCVYFFFAPQDLTCYVGNTSTTMVREVLKITVSKVEGKPSMDISKCSRNSKAHQSRSQELICFKQNERSHTISSVTPCTLQSTETKTTKPTDHVFVFCNEIIRLYDASYGGDLDWVKDIIQEGVEDINCREKSKKRTPVMVAAKMGRGEVFDFLVSQGCQLSGVDIHNNNILHFACEGGNISIVRKLVVDEGIDVESRGLHGRTPIMVAAQYGYREVFDFLMNSSSNMKIVDSYNETILHVACYDAHVDMVKHILSLNIPGIDTESRGNGGSTPIIMAAKYSYRELFDFLMNRGCNMKIMDYDNNTILHVARNNNQVNMVKYILSLNISSIQG